MIYTILVIDDPYNTSSNFEENLNSNMFSFFYTVGVNNSINIIKRYEPDLIIFKITKDDEIETFFNLLNNDKNLIKIPVIYISSEINKLAKITNFGVDAFLLEPVKFVELENLIKLKLKKFEARNSIEDIIKQENFENISKSNKNTDHVLITIGNKINLIKFDQIKVIEAQKEYSSIICENLPKIIVRKSLRHWMQLLPINNFLRIHRATIININYINKIHKQSERNYVVYINGIKEALQFSQRFANTMRRTFPKM